MDTYFFILEENRRAGAEIENSHGSAMTWRILKRAGVEYAKWSAGAYGAATLTTDAEGLRPLRSSGPPTRRRRLSLGQ